MNCITIRLKKYISSFCVLVFVILLSFDLQAATINVNSFEDIMADDGLCTLREAVYVSNHNTTYYNSEGECVVGDDDAVETDTINLVEGTYSLSITSSGSDEDRVGDLDIEGNVNIIGAGKALTIIDASDLSDRIFEIGHDNLDFTLSQVTIQGGNVADNGGGIYSSSSYTGITISLDNVSVINNTAAGFGGGVCVYHANLNINESNINNNEAPYGGGISLLNSTSGNQVLVASSNISYNSADAFGGGVSSFLTDAVIYLVNTTISNNSLTTGKGGGIYFGSLSEAYLYNTTLAENSIDEGDVGSQSGGGMFVEILGVSDDPVIVLRNTLIANNYYAGAADDLYGTVVSEGYNLVEAHVVGSILGSTIGNILGEDPGILTLADNGGVTETHALSAESVAIDAGGDCVDENGDVLTTDQRGYERPIDGNGDELAVCDIGAFEYNPETDLDADGDGAIFSEDCDDDNASVYPDATEICGDGINNDCDAATSDTCPSDEADPDPDPITDPDPDTDDDEPADEIESDRDGDLIMDDEDAFPDDPTEWLDTDGDGIGDNADDDDDGDGILDVDEELDPDPDPSAGEAGGSCSLNPYSHTKTSNTNLLFAFSFVMLLVGLRIRRKSFTQVQVQ